MIQITLSRVARPAALAASMLTAMLVGGCVSYAPSELSAMSGLDLCDIQANQRVSLTDESKRALDSELQRRSENCRTHMAEIQARRDADMYRRMYGGIDDP